MARGEGRKKACLEISLEGGGYARENSTLHPRTRENSRSKRKGPVEFRKEETSGKKRKSAQIHPPAPSFRSCAVVSKQKGWGKGKVVGEKVRGGAVANSRVGRG